MAICMPVVNTRNGCERSHSGERRIEKAAGRDEVLYTAVVAARKEIGGVVSDLQPGGA